MSPWRFSSVTGLKRLHSWPFLIQLKLQSFLSEANQVMVLPNVDGNCRGREGYSQMLVGWVGEGYSQMLVGIEGESFSPMGENPLWISNSNIKTHSWCKLTCYEPGKLQKWFQSLSKMDYFSWPLSRKYLCWTLRYNLPLNTFFFLQLMSLWKAILIIKECSFYTIFYKRDKDGDEVTIVIYMWINI